MNLKRKPNEFMVLKLKITTFGRGLLGAGNGHKGAYEVLEIVHCLI